MVRNALTPTLTLACVALAMAAFTGCAAFEDKSAVDRDTSTPGAGDDDDDDDATSDDDDASGNDDDASANDDDASGNDDDASGNDDDATTDDDDDNGAAAVIPEVPSAGWVADAKRTPRNIHMTWQQDPATTIALQWETDDISLKNYKPYAWVVEKSKVENVASNIADTILPFLEGDGGYVTLGAGEIYKETLAGSAVGNEEHVQWTVDVKNLKPDTEYLYRVGTWKSFDTATRTFEDVSVSNTGSFRTGLAKGDRSKFLAILAGDSRGGYTSVKQIIPRLADRNARFWVFNGDMNQIGTKVEWDQWFDAMNDLLIKTPLMPVQGNHETFAGNYYSQFALPRMGGKLPEAYAEQAWSFDFGNVHVIGLNSNVENGVVAQSEWLKEDIKKAKADPDIDWVIAGFHHPVESAGTTHGPTERLKRNWQPIFEDEGVDFTFSGHDHIYERTCPVKGGQCVADGTGVVYMVAGAFFSPPYNVRPTPLTRVAQGGEGGNYVEMEVEGKSLKLTAFKGDGTKLDEYSLTK